MSLPPIPVRRGAGALAVIGVAAASYGAAAHNGAAPARAFVRVDQVGYATGAAKRAVLLGSGPASRARFWVRDGRGAVVLRGRPGRRLARWSATLPYAYPIDLSAVRTAGRYTLGVTGATARPAAFRVDTPAALYAPLVARAVHFLRTQRDAHAADHAAAIYATPAYRHGLLAARLRRVGGMGGVADVSGGWMDAGDTLKFAETASFTEVALLVALRDSSAALGPAAGPVRDEARYGLEWLLRLWDPAAKRLIYQVGLGDGNGHDVLGAHDARWRLPARDDALKARPGSPEYYVKYRPAFATSAPLSPNLAGRMAAAFALGAQVLGRDDPALRAPALHAAETIYASAATHWAGPLVTAVPHAFYPETEWRDDLELGAAELALATAGQPRSQDYLRQASTWATRYAVSPLNGNDSLNLYDVAALAHADLATGIRQHGLDRLAGNNTQTLSADLMGQQQLAAAQARRDPFGYAGSYRDDDVVAHALGWSVESGIIDELTGTGRLAAFGATQRDLVLGDNAWGTSFVVGAGQVFPRCLHSPIANLGGAALLAGAPVPGPAARDDLRGDATPPGARRCPAGGGSPFRRFDARGARYVDTVGASATVEPSIDLGALAVLAFARAAAG